MIEAPWRVNGGHGAAFRHRNHLRCEPSGSGAAQRWSTASTPWGGVVALNIS
eukprot:SAG25_NODE_272_length_10613_cov_6.416191_11_plen_52_part_00